MEMSDVNSLLRKVEENCDKKIAQIGQDIVERDRIYEKRMVQMEKELEDSFKIGAASKNWDPENLCRVHQIRIEVQWNVQH